MPCHYKTRYTSEQLAWVDAERIQEESGEYSRAYKCNLCPYWHTTSQPKGRRRKRKRQCEPDSKPVKFEEYPKKFNRPFARLLAESDINVRPTDPMASEPGVRHEDGQ